MSFKYLLLLVILTVASAKNIERMAYRFPPEITDPIVKAVKGCIKKTGAPADVVQLVRAGTYEEDETFRKFVHCGYRDSGYSLEDGHANVEKIVNLYPKEFGMYEVVANCNKVEGKDPVDITFKYFKCFQDNTPVRLAL